MLTSCKFSGGRRLTNVIKEQAWEVAVGSIYVGEVMHGAAGSGPGGQHPRMPVSGLAIIGSEMLIRMLTCDDHSCVISVPHLTARLVFGHWRSKSGSGV